MTEDKDTDSLFLKGIIIGMTIMGLFMIPYHYYKINSVIEICVEAVKEIKENNR